MRLALLSLLAASLFAGTHYVAVSWGASPSIGVIGYKVYRSETSGGPYTLLTTTSLVTGTTYNDSSIVIGHTYYYVITATDGTNDSVYSPETVIKIRAATATVTQK